MSLYYYEEATMKEIGLIVGVVESRVSQIHASAPSSSCPACYAHIAERATKQGSGRPL